MSSRFSTRGECFGWARGARPPAPQKETIRHCRQPVRRCRGDGGSFSRPKSRKHVGGGDGYGCDACLSRSAGSGTPVHAGSDRGTAWRQGGRSIRGIAMGGAPQDRFRRTGPDTRSGGRLAMPWVCRNCPRRIGSGRKHPPWQEGEGRVSLQPAKPDAFREREGLCRRGSGIPRTVSEGKRHVVMPKSAACNCSIPGQIS